MKKSIWFLILIASVLPELLTGSSSLSAFFNPIHLLILFLGYGVAVLVVREIAVRNSLSFGGIFVLGTAFGIFNEGFLAKTLIKVTGLPLAQYNDYGYFFGVNFPFTFAIGFWHAFAAVLMPILIVYWLYPEHSGVPWLNKKFTAFLTVALLFFGSASLLGESILKGNLTQLAILLGLIVIFFLISKRFKRSTNPVRTPASSGLKPVLLGMSIFFPYYLLLGGIAEKKAPFIIFLGACILVIWAYYRILKKYGWTDPKNLMLFGIGNYLQITILGGVLAFIFPQTMAERLLAGVVCIILLILFARKIRRSATPAALVA